MIRYRRPREPDNFADAVSGAIEEVRAAIAQRRSADDKVEFPPKWGSFKGVFFVAQHDKCGYCESNVRAVTHGDVEHYYPKAEVRQLENEGEENTAESNVKGRNGPKTSTGYWWRAYQWDNYLLSCTNCNQKWKLNFFPVKEDPRSSFPVGEDNADRPLVLNPFGRAKLENHLRFNRDQSVIGTTARGRATIRVCGLDRPSLRGARVERTELAADLIDAFLAALRADDETRIGDAILGLHRCGAARRTYAGAARSMFTHETGMDWADVEDHITADLIGRLKAVGPARRLVVIEDLKARVKDFDRRDRLDGALNDEFGVGIDDLIAELGGG